MKKLSKKLSSYYLPPTLGLGSQAPRITLLGGMLFFFCSEPAFCGPLDGGSDNGSGTGAICLAIFATLAVVCWTVYKGTERLAIHCRRDDLSELLKTSADAEKWDLIEHHKELVNIVNDQGSSRFLYVYQFLCKYGCPRSFILVDEGAVVMFALVFKSPVFEQVGFFGLFLPSLAYGLTWLVCYFKHDGFATRGWLLFARRALLGGWCIFMILLLLGVASWFHLTNRAF
jgi:hypothetical protein